MQTWAKLEKLRPSQIQVTMRPRVRPTTACTFLPVSMFSHTIAVHSGRPLNVSVASGRVSALAADPERNATAPASHAARIRRRRAAKDGTEKPHPHRGHQVAAGMATRP